MKYLNKLKAYTCDIKVLIMFTIIVLTVVMFVGVTSFSYINDALLEYNIIKDNRLTNAYFYARTISYSDIKGKNIDKLLMDTFFRIKDDPAVSNAYTTVVANYVRYDNDIYSIVLYDPGLVNSFPGLKKLGIIFSGDEMECVTASTGLNHLKTGDTIEVEMYHGDKIRKTSLKMCSHLVSPYKQMEFGGSGTKLIASDMFSSNQCIIMQAGEAYVNELASFMDVKYYPDVLFTIKDDASEEDVRKLFDELRISGTVDSLDAIIDNTEEMIRSSFMVIYIKPAVYLIAGLFALFSMVILMIRRKSAEMAVSYLVGASKVDLIALAAGLCVVITVVPAILNTVFVLTTSELNWKCGFLEQWGAAGYISSDLIWIILVYFALTIIISALAIIVSISGKSPLSYLRSLD